MGREAKADIELTDFEQNKKIAYKSVSGPAFFEELFLFEPAAGGTKVTARLELQPSGLKGLEQPAIASGLNHEVEEDVDCLKETLETRVVEAFELLE